MKNTIRVTAKNTSKQSPKQGQAHSELGQLSKLLGFTDQQMQAYASVAAWHGQSAKSYLRIGALGILQTSLDELQEASGQNVSPCERATRSLWEAAEPLFRDSLRDSLTIGGRPLDGRKTGAVPVSCPIPQSLADDARTALRELDEACAAAVTLLMMVADNFGQNMRGYAPHDKTGMWAEFTSFELDDAPLDLAINQIARFRIQHGLWRKRQLSIIDATRNPSHDTFENEILELNALLIFQANAFDHQFKIEDGTSPYLLAQSVADRLWAAYEKSLHFHSALMRVASSEPSKQAA